MTVATLTPCLESLESALPGADDPVAERRTAAWNRVVELGLPTSRWEEWRFTDVRPVTEQRWNPAPARLAVTVPDGVRTASLADALRDDEQADAVRDALGVGRDPAALENPFTALNDALWTDGVLIHVPRGVEPTEPVTVVHSGGAAGDVTHPRVLVVVEENARALVVERREGAGWTNAVTELDVGPGAGVEHVLTDVRDPDAVHIAEVRARIARDGRAVQTSLAFGSALARYEIHADLADTGASADLRGLYVTDGERHCDHHTTVDHRSPHTHSVEEYRGVLTGSATAVFNGRVIVRPDAQKITSEQENRNLVLSDEALVHTKPELQIFADDIKAAHGATVGRLDESAVFYLRTRGIPEPRARAILTRAFADTVLQEVPVDGLAAELGARLPGGEDAS